MIWRKKQTILIVIGPDMVGKTNIVKELSRITRIPSFKATSECTSFLSSRVARDDQFLNQLRFADPRVVDLLRQTSHSVIFDRGFPCEYAYSKVFDRETDMTTLKHLDEAYAALGAVIIFCQRSSYVGIKDDLDPTIEEHTLLDLHNAYEEFAQWTRCHLLRLNVDDENLDREVRDVVNFIQTQDKMSSISHQHQ